MAGLLVGGPGRHRLLAISTPTYNGDIRARDLVAAALHARKHGLGDSLHFHGIGDHGGGPARQNLDALRRFQLRPLLPASVQHTGPYTERVLATGAALPVQRGESSTIFEAATPPTGISNGTTATAKTSSAPPIPWRPWPALSRTLQPAWRTLLFNQFHDILDGSGIHETYIKCATDFEESRRRPAR